MAHSPSHLEQYCRLGGAVRHKGETRSDRARARDHAHRHPLRSALRIVAHKRIGKNVGVTDEQNAALEDWKSATCFDEVQRATLAFTDEIVTLRRPSDATFNAIASKLTPGDAGRTAARGRLLHHDLEVPGNVWDRHAAGVGSGLIDGRMSVRPMRCPTCPGHWLSSCCWRSLPSPHGRGHVGQRKIRLDALNIPAVVSGTGGELSRSAWKRSCFDRMTGSRWSPIVDRFSDVERSCASQSPDRRCGSGPCLHRLASVPAAARHSRPILIVDPTRRVCCRRRRSFRLGHRPPDQR